MGRVYLTRPASMSRRSAQWVPPLLIDTRALRRPVRAASVDRACAEMCQPRAIRSNSRLVHRFNRIDGMPLPVDLPSRSVCVLASMLLESSAAGALIHATSGSDFRSSDRFGPLCRSVLIERPKNGAEVRGE